MNLVLPGINDQHLVADFFCISSPLIKFFDLFVRRLHEIAQDAAILYSLHKSNHTLKERSYTYC